MTTLDEFIVGEGITQVYRIHNAGTWGKYSRKHRVYCYGRRYTLIGDINASEAEAVLRSVFQTNPERRITAMQCTPGGRVLYVYWQQDNPMA